MRIKLAVLDDDQLQLDVIEKQVESFNRNSENEIEVSLYRCSKDLLENFNHDLALVDINLNEQIDGFDVAKQLMKKHKKPVIMTSQFIEKEEALESLLSKQYLKMSELFNRFNILKRNPTKNVLQIFSSRSHYHVPAFAG